MEFTLTVKSNDPNEIARLLAAAPGATLGASVPQPVTITNTITVDDEAGPVNASAPQTDATGLPWDERIHAKTKALTETGAWRKRRGVADVTVTAVEAELRAAGNVAMPGPVHMPQPPANLATVPPVATMPVLPPMQPPAMVMTATPPAMPQPPAPVMVPQPVAPVEPAPLPTDFQGFMQRLGLIMQMRLPDGSPMLPAEYMAQLTAEIATAFQTQLNALTDMAAHPRVAEMVPYAVQLMQYHGRWA